MRNHYFNHKPLLLLLLLITYSAVSAQEQAVTFDIEKSTFNNGMPLPSEENFAVTGPIGEEISLVSLSVFSKNDNASDSPIFENYWKETFANEGDVNFYIPVNHKLKGGEAYNVSVKYYKRITQEEYDYISQSLTTYLGAYIDQHTTIEADGIKLTKRPAAMVNDLNDIVHHALSNYRIENNHQFSGFSDLVESNLEAIRKNKPDENREGEIREKYFTGVVEDLKELLLYEVTNHLNLGVFSLAETRFIKEYETEKTRTILTLHAGYGGVYFDGGVDNLSYDNGGFAGITFPLGRKALTSKFWSNSAIVVGVYFKNFENENDEKISGPIVKRPIYVGLGYKVFDFIRITGGITFLESKETAGNFENLDNNIFIRPYIGLQADLNFWADFAR